MCLILCCTGIYSFLFSWIFSMEYKQAGPEDPLVILMCVRSKYSRSEWNLIHILSRSIVQRRPAIPLSGSRRAGLPSVHWPLSICLGQRDGNYIAYNTGTPIYALHVKNKEESMIRGAVLYSSSTTVQQQYIKSENVWPEHVPFPDQVCDMVWRPQCYCCTYVTYDCRLTPLLPTGKTQSTNRLVQRIYLCRRAVLIDSCFFFFIHFFVVLISKQKIQQKKETSKFQAFPR